MWIIDEARIKQLERHGIIVESAANARSGQIALLEAERHLEALDYTAYKSAVRRPLAWRRASIQK